MQKKENQRTSLTKRLLRDGLIHLLSTESIHKISVRELCDTAGINRSTFYKYYGSQYDLLADIEDELMDLIQKNASGISPADDKGISNLTLLIQHLEQNIDLARLMLNNNIDPEFPEKLINLPPINSSLKEHIGRQYRDEHFSYISAFVIHGFYNMIRLWLNSDQREPAEEIAGLLINIISKLSIPGEKAPS